MAYFSGCLPAPALPSPTNIASPTLIPSPTATITPSPIPTLENILSVPYPDEALIQSAVEQFVNAMSMAGIDLDFKKTIADLEFKHLSDINGLAFTVGLSHLDPDPSVNGEPLEGYYPLLLADKNDNGEWKWSVATLKHMGLKQNVTFETFLLPDYPHPKYETALLSISSEIVIPGELDADRIFEYFSISDWQKIVQNWVSIQSNLTNEKVPEGFPYSWLDEKDWNDPNTILAFTKKHNLRVRAQHLLFPNIIPTGIVEGNFSADEVKKLVEFIVKVRVIQYKGQIQTWDVCDEVVANRLYGSPENQFYYERFGFDICADIANWVKEIEPTASTAIVEDTVIEKSFGPALHASFLEFLRRMKEINAPIDMVIPENNLWVYDPPSQQEVRETFDEINALGYKISGSETCITMAQYYPTWKERPRTVEVENPVIAQSVIYGSLLESYLDKGINQFGFAHISDALSWMAISTDSPDSRDSILDENMNPKPAYFALLRVILERIESSQK